MSDQNVNAIQLSMQQMDEIQASAATLAHGAAKSFADVYKYALVSQQIMATLTPEVINNVFLPMRNKDFGWREDVPMKYQMQDLRDVFTSAILYGAMPANNEILIISGRFYPQKNFFTRKLAELPGLTDLILKPGKVTVAPNGAHVNYSATWKLHGKPMSMERVGDSAIPVRLNTGQGVDAALGKAERKIKAAIYNQLTGSTFSEGEGDETAVEGVPTSGGVVVTAVVDETPGAPAKSEDRSVPVVSQTAAVTAAVASKRAEKPAPTGPQPWEGAGAEPAPAKLSAAEHLLGHIVAPKQQTVAQASAPVQQRQPTPLGQSGPQVAVTTGSSAATSQPVTTTKATTKLAPSPKFDASGTGEVMDVTLKVLKILGPKPPHRILMEDNIEYWTKDTEKAKSAKALCDQGVPVFVEYIVEPSGKPGVADFRVVIDLKLADFGPGEGDQGGEDQPDFDGGGERVVE